MTVTSQRHRAWSLVLALAGGLFGCHECGRHDSIGWDSDLVGGGCNQDKDCVERCVEGGNFPDGTCTVDCDDDFDCPDGTVCIDRDGGVCLLACGHDDDCRPGYDCRDTDLRGGNGDAPVCIGG